MNGHGYVSYRKYRLTAQSIYRLVLRDNITIKLSKGNLFIFNKGHCGSIIYLGDPNK